jgi:hypothetical protein
MRSFLALGLFFALSGIHSPKGEGATIKLPNETAAYKAIPGVDLANGYCLTCHSVDYVANQPPGMPRAFWLAEVTKMKNVFGAPITDDQVPQLVDYLVRAYGDPNGK